MTWYKKLAFVLNVVCMLHVHTSHANEQQWSEDLLNLAGTTIIFEQAPVQQALVQQQTPNLGQMIQQSDFREWAGARLWLISLQDNKIQAFTQNATLNEEAGSRGLSLNYDFPNDNNNAAQQFFNQGRINFGDLKAQLAKQHADAVVFIQEKNNLIFWQLYTEKERMSGTVNQDALPYLPHIWSEHLAMAWQWPELKQDILLRIDNIRRYSQLRAAEQAIANACRSSRLLKVTPNRAEFACKSANNLIPEKLNLVPQLVLQPASTKNLSTNALMGRQLAQRFALYQWQDL
ncbi:hypothetical protein [Agitococcus lubricus]|uniref:Uncharacterized protein n=1 Tax=Agitococcus lubricus TaxID=1077255 RepID=A0A2T5IZ27_9GAMM|nr:hypothetical protein [Agitococcus lubricus]PTQ89293.1 hypothetical protein C8N29_10721 [Agitococcus lubricus]